MIRSWHAFVMCITLLTCGFVLTIFYPKAPFVTYSAHLVGALGLYLGKRLIQKKEEYHNDR